ncbi:MAG: CDP-glycerol glycerophosphotransferase family protein [Lentisphaeria bacterium]|nr:CDP-glycerol glycerophosphotransferase family protein [Lentisphaeria bacterium]
MLKEIIETIKRLTGSILLLLLSFAIRRRKEYVAIGSWGGENYIDNGRYLAEYICKNRKDLKVFWVGTKKTRDEVEKKLSPYRFLEKDTVSANIALLKCRYMFCTQMHNSDISSYNVFRNATICYLHHGMPLKKWGEDGLNQMKKDGRIKALLKRIMGNSRKYEYFVTSGPEQDLTFLTALKFRGCTENNEIHSGTPRNDMYFNVDKQRIEEEKTKYSGLVPFEKDKKIIMYLPTYRRTSKNVSFTGLSDDETLKLNRLLEKHNAVILEKLHLAATGGKVRQTEFVKHIPAHFNVQELMLFADVLISDYSGAFLDFLFLDRPVVNYVYDYDFYKNTDSGLYYDIDEFMAGPVCRDFDSLLAALDETLSGTDRYHDRREAVKNRFMAYETGHASEMIVREVIDKA